MSVFQYTAEAYRLLLMLVGLIIDSLFGPLRYVTWTVLLACILGAVWLFTVWRRRRQAAIVRRR